MFVLEMQSAWDDWVSAGSFGISASVPSRVRMDAGAWWAMVGLVGVWVVL